MADGEPVRDLMPNDPRIRLVETEGKPAIGEKRNFACERAQGEIILHWDDDDFSAPGRLADQIARLDASGLAVTGYHSMRFIDGAHWWLFQGGLNYAVGTSLCYRRTWWQEHRFPARQVGEDNEFVREAAKAEQIVTADAGELMYATIHAGNTSPRQKTGAGWKLIA